MSFLALTITTTNAQYFSSGWTPGQKEAPTAPAEAPEPTFVPKQPGTQPGAAPAGMFDLSRILTSGPVASLFASAGINISEKMDQALVMNKFWDDRIPLITDDNYGEMIVNETLTEEEEEERVWFLAMYVFLISIGKLLR